MSQPNRVRQGDFLPSFIFSVIFSLAAVWVVIGLMAAGEEVSTNPFLDGALFTFSLTLSFVSLSALLREPFLTLMGSRRLINALTVALLIGVVAVSQYVALLLGSGIARWQQILISMIVAAASIAFAFGNERNKERLLYERELAG